MFLLTALLAAAAARAEAALPSALPAAPPPAEACPIPALEGTEDADDDEDADVDDPADEEKEEDPAAANGAPVVDPEAEEHGASTTPANAGQRYTSDVSDADLAKRWKGDLAALGPMSVGFADSGRLINGVRFPKDGNWIVVSPESSWGTQETVDGLVAAIAEVNRRYPDSPPLRVNHLSRKDGGWLRPHKSHQSGRDVDLAFYYPTAEPIRIRKRETCIDVARTWALSRALVTNADVQFILVDRRVQHVLYEYALASGEDKAWLDALFRSGKESIFQHARRHRDHLHVRFFNPRAQELGRRVQPLLALRPEHNVVMHRIRSGDNLGRIAKKYGTTIALIKRANAMRGTFLRAGRRLQVPLRGPCTKCPLPPEVVVPPRRLPPEVTPLVAAPLEKPAEVVPAAAPAEAPVETATIRDAVEGL